MRPALVLSVIVSASVLASCSSLKTRTAHTKDIQGPVVHTPVLADLDVQESKATATVSASAGNSIDATKNLAIAEVLKATNADLLVEPTFDVQKKNGKNIVTVTGFPAKYKNFRPARAEDIALMDAGTRYLTTTNKGELAPEKKKGGAGIIAGLAGVALLSLLIGAR